MDAIINTFHIDWKIMVAQAFNFGVVFVLLYWFALRPLTKIMRERTEKIEKGLKDAKENAEMLNNTEKEYKETILKAKNEAHQLFQDGKKEAEAKKKQMMIEAENEVAQIIANGKKSLESEKAKMLSETKGEIANLAIKMAEKLMNTKMDGAFDDKTVKELNNL